MNKKRMAIDHPLWNKLRDLDRTAVRRFCGTRYDLGFGALGLILDSRPRHGGYWCTPTNSLAFARTGGNGVHFSFLVRDGKVTDDCPIVISKPMDLDAPNLIGGASLLDFLCLGCRRGFFALETLPSDKCLKAYGSADWQPADNRDYLAGYGVNEHQRKLLDFLIAKLRLSPWKDLKRKFRRLQKQYMPLLEIPDGASRSGSPTADAGRVR